MEYKDLLENYRAQIDTLDKELLYLFSRRFEIVRQIGILKKENNIEALQQGRWKDLLEENLEVGNELGLNNKFITGIWERIHEESLQIEK